MVNKFVTLGGVYFKAGRGSLAQHPHLSRTQARPGHGPVAGRTAQVSVGSFQGWTGVAEAAPGLAASVVKWIHFSFRTGFLSLGAVGILS